MVLRESLLLLLAGIALGLPAAYGVGRLLKASLFGLEPHDPATYALAMLGIGLVALAASFVPARRAASVDPMLALRSE